MLMHIVSWGIWGILNTLVGKCLKEIRRKKRKRAQTVSLNDWANRSYSQMWVTKGWRWQRLVWLRNKTEYCQKYFLLGRLTVCSIKTHPVSVSIPWQHKSGRPGNRFALNTQGTPRSCSEPDGSPAVTPGCVVYDTRRQSGDLDVKRFERHCRVARKIPWPFGDDSREVSCTCLADTGNWKESGGWKFIRLDILSKPTRWLITTHLIKQYTSGSTGTFMFCLNTLFQILIL